MSFWSFLKSTAGKVTMIGTTAIAGIAANFVAANSIQDDMKVEIIKENLKPLVTGDPSTLSSSDTWGLFDDLKTIVDDINNGAIVDDSQKFVDAYANINSDFDKVPLESHFQAFPLEVTVVAVAVIGIIWLILYLKAKKTA